MKKLLLALALLVSTTSMASDDFGIWTGIGAEKKLPAGFSIDAGIGFRAEDNLNSAARWDFNVGLGYKPCKNIKFGAGYVLIRDHSLLETKVNYNKKGNENGYNVDHDYWRTKHRFVFDVTGKVDIGRFTLSLRERYQLTHANSATCVRDRYRDELDRTTQGGYTGESYTWNGREFLEYEQTTNDKSGKTTNYLRSRLQLEYNIRHCPLTPFVSYELSNDLSGGFSTDKTRLSVGTDWKISKHHTVSVAYLYQNGHDDDDNNDIHVIDLSYKFKF